MSDAHCQALILLPNFYLTLWLLAFYMYPLLDSSVLGLGPLLVDFEFLQQCESLCKANIWRSFA